MTWREKISKEQPERVDDYEWGNMIGCPTDNHDYGLCIGSISSCELCTRCWDREVPKIYLTDADVIADMYHQLINRGLPSGTAEIIVYKMIDHGYFDKK